ncbi:MAG: hypothetical protein PHQ35_11170 [Phycisphaerae bacterium]|nr:hypothetical protein [Phycisphaerae bacterium]
MKTLEIDAHKWIRNLRLEYYRVASIRKLHVGDSFWIACFSGDGVTQDTDGWCECYIERIRGGYRFSAVWTIMLGKKSRPVIMTSGEFKLLSGNLIRFKSVEDLKAEKTFRKVCRYSGFIARHGKEYGIDPIYIGSPEHRHALWRGTTVFKDGYTAYGIEGVEPRGLGAIVDAAIALGALGIVD